MSDKIPQMAATSDSDARAMAALGASPTDPNPEATAQQAMLSKSESVPTRAGPPGQDKADGSDMTPAPALNKSDLEDEEDDDEEENEEKSMDATVTEDELIKALDSALEIARGASGEPDPDRRAELAEKLSKGDIDANEALELQALIKSSLPPDETDEDALNKSFTEAALEDPDVTAGHTDGDFDVSGWIARQSAFVGGALDQINDGMSKSFAQLSNFNVAMAKANRSLGQRVVEQGQLIKSLTERLSTVENAPMPRVGVPTVRALNKSLAVGQQPDVPSRTEIIEGLTSLNKSSADGKAPCGLDLTEAIARFESVGQIHPALIQDMRKR